VRSDREGQIYRREDSLWDWRVRSAGNHEITSTSGGQGFTERNDAREAGEREHPDVTFEDVDE
jgi:uncharacterized protein YegP (UPF0339 family)